MHSWQRGSMQEGRVQMLVMKQAGWEGQGTYRLPELSKGEVLVREEYMCVSVMIYNQNYEDYADSDNNNQQLNLKREMQCDQKSVRFDTSFVNCLIQKEQSLAENQANNQFSSSDASDFNSQNDEPVLKEESLIQANSSGCTLPKPKLDSNARVKSEQSKCKDDSSLNDSNQNTNHSGFLYDNLSLTQKTSGSSITTKMDLNFEEKFSSHQSSKKYQQQQQTPYQQIQKKRRFEPQKEIYKFIIDLEKLYNGLDQRTTLMIRNIPNKYNQVMLLKEFDEEHSDSYDFFYLPIDFTNRCNVGYAFINFQEPRFIPSFYMRFHNKRWRMYNSEKICQLTYARIQGKDALLNHFQFSSIMNQKDKKVKPVFFQKHNLSQIEALLEKQKLFK